MPLNDLSGFMMPSTMPGAAPGLTMPQAPPQISAPLPPAQPTFSSPLAGPAPPPQMPPVGDLDPGDLQYDTETQVDGTLLLRVRLPDGTVGPVVAHLPPPKLKGKSAPSTK